MSEARFIADGIHPLRAAAVRALSAYPNGREWHSWTDEVRLRTKGQKLEDDAPGWIKIAGDPLFEFYPLAQGEFWALTPLGREVLAILHADVNAGTTPTEGPLVARDGEQ